MCIFASKNIARLVVPTKWSQTRRVDPIAKTTLISTIALPTRIGCTRSHKIFAWSIIRMIVATTSKLFASRLTHAFDLSYRRIWNHLHDCDNNQEIVFLSQKGYGNGLKNYGTTNYFNFQFLIVWYKSQKSYEHMITCNFDKKMTFYNLYQF